MSSVEVAAILSQPQCVNGVRRQALLPIAVQCDEQNAEQFPVKEFNRKHAELDICSFREIKYYICKTVQLDNHYIYVEPEGKGVFR